MSRLLRPVAVKASSTICFPFKVLLMFSLFLQQNHHDRYTHNFMNSVEAIAVPLVSVVRYKRLRTRTHSQIYDFFHDGKSTSTRRGMGTGTGTSIANDNDNHSGMSTNANKQTQQALLLSTNLFRKKQISKVVNVNQEKVIGFEKEQCNENSQNTPTISSASASSVWPPWPFSLLNKQKEQQYESQVGAGGMMSTRTSDTHTRTAALFFTYLRRRARLGLQQIQHAASAVSLHLPPASPIIVLLAILPTKQRTILEDAATTAIDAAGKVITISPPLSLRIARKLALASLAVAVLSWADYEIRKNKYLTPLPLVYHDLKKVVLPPFLPENVDVNVDDEKVAKEAAGKVNEVVNEDTKQHSDQALSDTSASTSTYLSDHTHTQSMKQNLEIICKAIQPETFTGVVKSWNQMNTMRRKQEEQNKRNKIFNQLVVIQDLKRKKRFEAQKKNNMHSMKKSLQSAIGYHGLSSSSSSTSTPPSSSQIMTQSAPSLGYALITGASRGIGRAIAIELARYEIPLILVARDTNKLKSLAQDIQTAYGVPCIVLQADLSKPGTAKQIYQSTQKAKLRVDILVNNAGVCTNKDVIESSEYDIDTMVNVNVNSVTNLSYFYGKDMKQQRRGRILFVSSITGVTPSGPGVATYAATKAYEKSFAQSIGRELEKYGVGVTCLMPGAVKTTFAANSNSANSLCFKVPFYPMNASEVASRSIRALLSGDAEVLPGWHNRFFVKIIVPFLPPRLTSSIVGFAWSPVRFGLPFISQPSKMIDLSSSQQQLELEAKEQPMLGFEPRTLILEQSAEKVKKNDVLSNGEDDEDIGEDSLSTNNDVGNDNTNEVEAMKDIDDTNTALSSEAYDKIKNE
mmetsp:Transcript_18615/g.21495  ORF Transcript_18615/g.21495 Transcript_18615/m.21495 type:complete len:856 (-) Transcript_18615:3-2570(-)